MYSAVEGKTLINMYFIPQTVPDTRRKNINYKSIWTGDTRLQWPFRLKRPLKFQQQRWQRRPLQFSLLKVTLGELSPKSLKAFRAALGVQSVCLPPQRETLRMGMSWSCCLRMTKWHHKRKVPLGFLLQNHGVQYQNSGTNPDSDHTGGASDSSTSGKENRIPPQIPS